MPLISMTVPPVQAAAITLPILMVQDAVSVWAYRQTWDRTNLKILLPGAVFGILLAFLFAARVPDAAVALALGTISVVFALRRFIGGRAPVPPRAHVSTGRRAGSGERVAGFTSMIAHAGGPPFQIYVMPQQPAARHLRRHRRHVLRAVNLIKVAPYLALGQFRRGNLMTSRSCSRSRSPRPGRASGWCAASRATGSTTSSTCCCCSWEQS